MQLRKTNEKVNRTFNEGQQTENIESIQFQIVDDAGKAVGNASIGETWGNASLNISGFTTIEEGKTKLLALFNNETED